MMKPAIKQDFIYAARLLGVVVLGVAALAPLAVIATVENESVSAVNKQTSSTSHSSTISAFGDVHLKVKQP
jgi:hypothetical protein